MPTTFDPATVQLHALQVAVFHGLIFITFGNESQPFDALNIDAAVWPFDLDNAKVAAERSYTVDANWKLAIENYHECYHCVTAHPEYSRIHSLRAPEQETAELRAAMEQRLSGVEHRSVERHSPR